MERPTAGSAATEQDCARQLRDLQHSARAPGIAAAIVRSGALTWSDSVGLADLEAGTAPTLDTQFAIGSITKTFTAVLLLQLRDLGRLRLEDRLDLHLPGVAHGDVTLARMLAHLSGLRREPAAGPGGEIWETLQDPDRADLVDGVQRAGRVLEPGRRWHYSNLAFALLGEVVARSFALPWEAALRERLLEPLGMSRTTLEPVEPRARGYLVEPYSDVACPEPLLTLRGMQGLGKVRACVVGYGWVSDPGRGEAGTAPRDHVGIQAHDYSGPPCLPPHHPPLPRPPSGWPRPYPWHPSSALVCSTTSPRSPIHATDEVDGTR
jgi:CubicO group peptidase (beta-lactamase class C family)